MLKNNKNKVDDLTEPVDHRPNMMLRQQAILDFLDVHDYASYEALGELLKTSTMTVRRDVEAMAKKGLVIKTLGGTSRQMLPKSNLYESDIHARVREQREEKRAIALEVPSLLANAQSVFLDAGTTMIETAKVLAQRLEGKNMITNSLLVCGELAAGGKNRVTMLGGDLSSESGAFTGLMTEENAQSFYYDAALFSTKGFILEEGTYESSLENFRVKQIVAPRARQVILLVDHTKFGLRALRRVLEVTAFHCVVTDQKTSLEDIRSLERRGIRVIVADGSGGGGAKSIGRK